MGWTYWLGGGRRGEGEGEEEEGEEVYLFFHHTQNHHTFLGTTFPNGIFGIFTWIKFQWTLHYRKQVSVRELTPSFTYRNTDTTDTVLVDFVRLDCTYSTRTCTEYLYLYTVRTEYSA